IRALVRVFLPSTKPLVRRVGRKSKKARISRRQLRKADKALRNSLGPSALTVAIQLSNCAAAVAAEAVAYQVRKASLSCQAAAISGKAAAKLDRLCSSSAERASCLRKKRWRCPSKAFLPASALAQRAITLPSALPTCWIT